MLSDDSSCSMLSLSLLFFTVFSDQFTDYCCDVSLIIEEEIFYHHALGKISLSLYMVERVSNLTHNILRQLKQDRMQTYGNLTVSTSYFIPPAYRKFKTM